MKQPYYAFYWTYPVPWAGFRRLSKDIEKAVRESATIRYSRAAVHAHLSTEGGELVPGGEVVRLERYSDRGSKWLAGELAELLDKAADEDAKVAIVDFSEEHGSRSHQYLKPLYGRPNCDPIRIEYPSVHYGMNPFEHFRQRRKERMERRAAGKSRHQDEVLTALEEFNGPSWPKRADHLNRLKILTVTGREWTGDSLRHFVNDHSLF